MTRALAALLPLLAALPALADSPREASFPCKGKLSQVEKAICDSAALSTLDAQVADAWKRASKLSDGAAGRKLKAAQREWIKTRNSCGTDQPCIEKAYRVRLEQLQKVGPQDVGEGGLRPVLTWPRMGSQEFGCMLELAGQRDPAYHCKTKKVDPGDPCKNVKAWTAGPAFPDLLTGAVHPGIDRVQLEWEHADLRVVRLHLRDPANAAEVRKQAGLPEAGAPLPENVQSIEVEGDEIVLTAFEHMGAGDAECGE